MNVPPRHVRPVALAAFLALLAPAAFAAAGTIADAKGCRFVDPFPKDNERIAWTGECRDGWGHGPGLLTWFIDDKPSSFFKGTLAAGQPVDGTETFHGGNRYEGRFVDGRPQGRGVFTWANGMRYEGGFEQGQMSGDGTLQLPDFTRFEGRFEHDLLAAPVALVKPQIGGEVRVPLETADAAIEPPAVATGVPGAPNIQVTGTCSPQYPPAAVRAQATGRSGFALLVEPDSRVRRIRWFHHSGSDFVHQLLDLTALASLMNCAIAPGTLDDKPAERWMPIEYLWKLE